MLLSGVGALIKKEFLNLLREPKSAFTIFFPIVLFLTLFIYASTKDVENASIAIFNEDSGIQSYNLINDVVNTKVFSEVIYTYNNKDFEKTINTEKAFIGLHFPKNFSKEIYRNEKTNLQVILDGRRTNAANITSGYLSQIFHKFQLKFATKIVKNVPGVTVRTWYNPNKEPTWFSITNLICIIIVSQAISLTALAIAREKEQGTFDQLLVSPIMPLGILVGKITPCVGISLFMGLIIMFSGSILYGVPIQGNLLLMLFSLLVYAVATVGIGVCIAAFANTQQQSMLGTFMVSLPMTSLSGLMSPVESITNPIMKAFVVCNPVVYGNRLVKGIMLKDASIISILENLLPLVLIGIVVLGTASIVFAKKHRLKIF